MPRLFASVPLYALAAAFCVARGLWVASRLAGHLRAPSGGTKRWAFYAGAGINVLVYVVGGVGVLAGLEALRWLLAAELARIAVRDVRSNAVAAAEGRKAGELAAAWEYVRNRARPKFGDYLIAALIETPLTLLPAVILAWGP